jgi:hypothetical protein
MATKKPTAAPSKSTAVATWDEELAKAAAASAAMEESAAGGQFFSIKGGQLTWNDAPIPNSTIGAVILDSVLENVYYEGDYDPDTPQAPTCFAFGRDDKTMTPHKVVVEAGQAMYGAAKQCDGCEMNEFGTADRGKGKACRNVRRVALLAAGSFDKDGRFQLFDNTEAFETAAFGFMKIPVTSVKGYASYVKTIAETLKRPPWAVVTKITVKPDAKTQVRVTFEPMMNAPDELLAALKKRHEEAAAVIEFPYQLDDGEKKAAPPARGKPGKPAAKKTARRY